jgi:hypothetical protein
MNRRKLAIAVKAAPDTRARNVSRKRLVGVAQRKAA